MNPYTLASDGLVQYTGDMNPLDNDGAWIDPGTWKSDGYASCVRVNVMPDGPDGGRYIIVERLTINKPTDMGPALRCCGQDVQTLNAMGEAECCLSYGHYDPDHSDYREAQSVGFIVLDDEDGDRLDFMDYARIHGATIVEESEVWELLADWVGRKLKVS